MARDDWAAHDEWADGGELESSREDDAASDLERTQRVADGDWVDSGEPESARGDDAASRLEGTTDVARAGWVEDSGAVEQAGAEVSAGFAVDEDDEPTGFVPVIGDDWPTGSFPALDGFADEATEADRHSGDERDGAPHGVRGESAADVVARMSIPGLGLVGADGPRIAPPPGSIEEAMRSEVERPRPRPQESEAMKALHDWCRARTAIVPSGFTIQIQVLDPSAPSYRFDLEPPEVDDPEFAMDKLSGLLGDLWQTEAQSDVGGWLFARIDAAGRTLRIDRWYDQVPDWWDNPIEPRLDVHGLVRRLYNRGPQWQPSYLEKLYTTAR